MSRFIGAEPGTMELGAGRLPARPAILHIAHSWGGGVERWVRDFAAADAEGWNLLLRSRTWRNEAGVRLELVDLSVGDEAMLAWDLAEPIEFTAIGHGQYRAILDELVSAFGVEAVLVSSLIGHSLDALGTGLPTAVVLHDLYPFCPALFGWFGESCRQCDGARLERCLKSNPLNVFWHHGEADRWQALRAAYAERIATPDLRVVAPSRAVHERYAALFPALREKPWSRIGHGLGAAQALHAAAAAAGAPASAGRFRVLVPGRLLPHKGLDLFRALLPELLGFADVMLLGCGQFGEQFDDIDGVFVVHDYANERLAEHLRAFVPDCALLLSTLPETFSYTLSEMWALGVPVVATRLGAFAERIEEGVTGFLVEPAASAVLTTLRALEADREALQQVAAAVRARPPRSAAAMVADYRRALGIDAMSDSARPRPGMLAAALAGEFAQRRWLRAERARLEAEIVDRERAMAGAGQRAADLEALLAEAHARARADADEAGRALSALALERDGLQAQCEAILASSSWRLTRPLRAVTEAMRGSARQRDGTTTRAEASAEAVAGQGGAASPVEISAPSPESASPPPAPQAIVRMRSGDLLACRRGRALAERLAAAVEVVGEGDIPLPAGVSLLVQAGDPPRRTACFEGSGQDEIASISTRCGDTGLDRALVPAAAITADLLRCHPTAAATTVTATLPLAGRWPRQTATAAARSAQRERLGIPDRARIVLAIGLADARSGLLRFADLATRMAERRNDFCFVWLGGVDAFWFSAHRSEIGAPVATRRLFIENDEDFEPWLQAADAYLGCRPAGVHDGGVVEALAAGLPVAVMSAATLSDGLQEAAFAGSVEVAADGDAVLAWLERDATGAAVDVRRTHLAQRVQARFGAPAVLDAFAAACLGRNGTPPLGSSATGMSAEPAPSPTLS